MGTTAGKFIWQLIKVIFCLEVFSFIQNLNDFWTCEGLIHPSKVVFLDRSSDVCFKNASSKADIVVPVVAFGCSIPQPLVVSSGFEELVKEQEEASWQVLAVFECFIGRKWYIMNNTIYH
mmetsp:Transcript_88929/g.256480  ORF Transcript_88929/g.256480 Transcript_88929/m.256480 type:complete len:120 (+) Transcript_88929:652-1011(+)